MLKAVCKTALALTLILLTTVTPLAAAETPSEIITGGSLNKRAGLLAGYGDINGADGQGDNGGGLTPDEAVVKRASETGFTVEDIAIRMYYLGFITGSSFDDMGTPRFNLDEPLSRIDALLLSLRIMGAVDYAGKFDGKCEFNDVGDWAKPFVAYADSEGLLPEMTADREFEPSKPADPGYFYGMLIRALCYDTELFDPAKASENAVAIGIADKLPGETLTRGEAVTAMWSALRTYRYGTSETLSDKFVNDGVIDYNDALFFIWSENAGEVEQYISVAGYSLTKKLADGYYTIKIASTGLCLNVLADGSNSDYEGVGVTVWQSTGDITQKFRVERTERGTYRIYSAASKGGYYRLLGFNYNKTGSALWRDTSPYAEEYYIVRCYDAEDAWYIIPASDDTAALTVTDVGRYTSHVAAGVKDADKKDAQLWRFEASGITTTDGEERAIFPNDTLNITQGAFDTYSHMKQNAIDCVSDTRYFAPFTGKITAIADPEVTAACNAVWFESASKVRYADGTVDYMTVCFMHDDDVSDLYVGQVIMQGHEFMDAGMAGAATGEHMHIAVFRGRNVPTDPVTGSGDIYVEEALFVLHDTAVREPYELEWNILP